MTQFPWAFSDELAAIAHQLQQSTVMVQSSAGSQGAGVIWPPSGLIVTNAHVVPQRRAWITLATGQRLPAHRVAHNQRLDLAALKVPADPLPAARVGDAAALQVGQLVMAVGHPQGNPGATTLGMVHTKPPIPRWVQADISLAPGYSGGPLATLAGEVVGLNTLIAGGRGLAIPTALVARFLAGQRAQPYLGVTLHPLENAGQRRGRAWSGATEGPEPPTWMVTQVAGGSPAAQAGLVVGDRLLGVNGRLFHHPSDLTDWLECWEPGQTLALQVSQGGDPVICTLTVGRPPVQEQAA